MKTIHKFHFRIIDEQMIALPKTFVVVLVGLDPAGAPCIWVQYDTEEKIRDTQIFVYGTGQDQSRTENSFFHAGSFLQGEYVWHVYIPRPCLLK